MPDIAVWRVQKLSGLRSRGVSRRQSSLRGRFTRPCRLCGVERLMWSNKSRERSQPVQGQSRSVRLCLQPGRCCHRIFGSVVHLPRGVRRPLRQPPSLAQMKSLQVYSVSTLFDIASRTLHPTPSLLRHGPTRDISSGGNENWGTVRREFSERSLRAEIDAPTFPFLESECRWWPSSGAEDVGQGLSHGRRNPNRPFKACEQACFQQERDCSQRSSGKLKRNPKSSRLRLCGCSPLLNCRLRVQLEPLGNLERSKRALTCSAPKSHTALHKKCWA